MSTEICGGDIESCSHSRCPLRSQTLVRKDSISLHMKYISIIVTVLNEEKTILQLLDALAQQTLLAHEIIIADGGSQDKTCQLVEKYALTHSQLHIHLIHKNGNRSVGRNAAISVAKNEWFAITDSGCVPYKDWLEKLSAKAEEVS